MVVVLAIAAYIVVRDLIRGYWTTRGAKVEHYTLHSRFVHQDLHEIRVVPARHGNWTLVFLHRRSAPPSSTLSHDIVDHPPHYSAPVWIDVGTEDPFHNARHCASS